MTSHSKALLLLVATAILPLTACMPNNDDPYPLIQMVDHSNVQGCKLVGNLTSSTHNYGLFTETANEARIKDVKIEAHKLGATHVVLDVPIEFDHTTTVRGQAYSCARPTSAAF